MQGAALGERRTRLVHHLTRYFTERTATEPGEVLVVAFSGGRDSTALLIGMLEARRALDIAVVAAHLDHGLDPDSSRRAARALSAARELGVDLHVERRLPDPEPETPDVGPDHGVEASARRDRYVFLERVRRRLGARWILTAHHRDDRAETAALRLLYGTGLEGLAGLQERHGRVIRPFFELPRSELDLGVVADDPSNLDLRYARNRVRHALLPAMRRACPDLDRRLASVSRAAHRARATVRRTLVGDLAVRPSTDGASICLSAYLDLPQSLRPFALSLLHRAAGEAWPPTSGARRELERQLFERHERGASGRRVALDCGRGCRWQVRGGRLFLETARNHRPSGLE